MAGVAVAVAIGPAVSATVNDLAAATAFPALVVVTAVVLA